MVQYKNWDSIHQPGNIINRNLRGGSLVQIHPDLKMGKSNAPRINNPLNNAIHFTIPFKNDYLHVFLVYIHPTSDIEESIYIMASQHKYALMIGDFNWNTPRKRRQINNFLKNSQFCKIDTDPTFIMPNNIDSTPDLIFITKNLIKNVKETKVLPDLGADHLAINIVIDLDKQPEETVITQKYQFHKCDTDRVNTKLSSYLEIVENEEITRDKITQFNRQIADAILQNTPKTKIKFYNYYLPPYIVSLIKKKRKQYRQYRLNPDPSFKRHINELSKNIHTLIKQFQQHRWLETCEEIKKSQGRNFYQKINNLSKYKKKTQGSAIAENGKEYNTDEEKAEIFSNSLRITYEELNDPSFDQHSYEEAQSWYATYFNRDMDYQPIEVDEEEYFSILHHQKNTNPGGDNIPWNVLKNINYRTHIYNENFQILPTTQILP